MKKIYLILSFVCIAGFANAQGVQPDLPEKRQQDIEALKVAFISKELNLTPDEAQKFWPVYNQYTHELRSAVKDNENILDRDEKVLNLRKRYKDQFSKVLGDQRMNRMYGAEGNFRQLLIKAMNRQQKLKPMRQNRQQLRNN